MGTNSHWPHDRCGIDSAYESRNCPLSHHYRFHVFALDEPIADTVTTAKALLAAMNGHALARGVLTGTYER